MTIKGFSDKIILPSKKDVLRVHLYLKLIQYGIKPFEKDIDIMLELYLFGGYSNAEEQSRFIHLCMEKKLKKSEQSLRNALSRFVKKDIFDKSKNLSLKLNDKYIPSIECDYLMLEHKITHAK